MTYRQGRNRAAKLTAQYPKNTRVRVQWEKDWAGEGIITEDFYALGDGSILVPVTQAVWGKKGEVKHIEAGKILGLWKESP